MGVEPQPPPRIPTDNANVFIEVLQSLQHSQQQMMEEICQLETDKTKEKGSLHDLEHVADKEDNSRRCPTECVPTLYHYGRSSSPPGAREG